MGLADAMIFLLVAFADLCLIVHLRRRRRRRAAASERMMRSLELHIRRELSPSTVVGPRKRPLLRAG